MRPSTYLDTATRPNACLGIVPRPSALSFLGKVPRPSTCLDTVTLNSACLDTVHQPSAMTCLGLVPRPRSCLDTVLRPSTMPSKGNSAFCHDKPWQGSSA